MLEFENNETIEVMDTQAWIESNESTIEVQLIVTNMRFLAVQEKVVVCSLNLEEIEKIEHDGKYTICWLIGGYFIRFDSDPIGHYLDKMLLGKQK